MDLESARTKNVRLNTMTVKSFSTLFSVLLVVLVAILVGLNFIPSRMIVKSPNMGGATAIDIIGSFACASDMLTPKYDSQIDRCWSHTFVFPDDNNLSQFFSLDMTAHRPKSSVDYEGPKNAKMFILWQGSKSKAGDNSGWENVASDSTERVFNFEQGRIDSNSVIVFKTSSVAYKQYFFQVRFLSDIKDLTFLESISFSITYERQSWVQQHIVIKSTFLALSIINFIIYQCYLSTVKRRLRSYEQNAVRSLAIGVIFYNNPFLFLEFVVPKTYFGWIDTVLQFSFIAILFTYWLIVYDGMRKDPPFSFSFYAFKIGFVMIFAIIGGALYLAIQIMEWNTPLFNWYQDATLVNVLLGYTVIAGVLYLGSLFYLIANGLVQEGNMTLRQRATFGYHFTVILLVIIGLIVCAVTTKYYSSATDYLYFYLVFNLYVWSLCYLYTPTTAENLTLDARDLANINSPDYGGSIVPMGKTDKKPSSVRNRTRSKSKGKSEDEEKGNMGSSNSSLLGRK